MLRRMAKKNPAPIDRLPSHQLRVHMVLQMLHTVVFYIQRSSEIPPGLTLGFTRKFQRMFYESGPPETPGIFRCMLARGGHSAAAAAAARLQCVLH